MRAARSLVVTSSMRCGSPAMQPRIDRKASPFWLANACRYTTVMLPAHRNEPAAPEAPRRRFRKLRIAWSMACGVVAVLICVLWVWSYWWVDLILGPISPPLAIGFSVIPGSLGIGIEEDPNVHSWTVETPFAVEEWLASPGGETYPSRIWGSFEITNGFASIPFWCQIMLTGAMAAGPWLRWRFSLRTLLIATTLIAILLGLIVWLR
jgi:hypothetical protein